jgi:hypothetical protein
MAADVSHTGSERFTEGAFDDGEVVFGDGSGRELCGDFMVGAVVAGDDHKAGGVAIEAVNDAGAVVAGEGGEAVLPVAQGEGVGECVFEVSWGWVDNKARRFIDNDEVGIFVEEGGFWEERVGRLRGMGADGELGIG